MNMWKIVLMLVAVCVPATSLSADEVLKPASERYSSDTQEVPSFQRHVLPLMGRAGCNGRSCHGSFQGQGGFRLSLFGYDFNADHDALTGGRNPRINKRDVPESLMLLKPTLEMPHKGGKRFEPGGWEYRLFTRWIESGAKGVNEHDVGFERLEVTPAEIVFTKPGETVQLRVVAVWRDGVREDVTPLCRFRTNDESVSEISADGKVTSIAAGDTHVVSFYDNGVAPTQTLLPVSDQIGPRYPAVPTPTRVDELIVQKLKTLGMVPSELCTDTEFLRRVSLDLTGTLPAPAEIDAFLADSSTNKRAAKIDELLERPAYSAWWATRLSDSLGNNPANFQGNNLGTGPRSSQLWYMWLVKRIRDNVPYDKIIEGMMLANSRQPGQSYEDFLAQMAAAFREKNPTNLNDHETIPFFWERLTFNQPPERSMAVAYAFLGVRLQCAQCHKHPFDQWTQDDFNQFTNFFGRVVFKEPFQKEEKERFGELIRAIYKDRKNYGRILANGEPFPFREVYLLPNGVPARKGKNPNNKRPKVTRSVTARALGDDPVDLPSNIDPRQLFMDWLREKDNPYFAKSFVNRVWAAYFGTGIVEPADDLNLANPPSNAPLLAYLEQGFVDHGYDMKWLHREIANSRTYQLSWQPNDTNRLDTRNFSHSTPRRLPAEVAVDAIQWALASDSQLATWAQDPSGRTITKTDGFVRNRGNSDYALGIFGRPARMTNCDCERSLEPSLLQTIYLRNDTEIHRKLAESGWLRELDRRLGVPIRNGSAFDASKRKRTPAEERQQLMSGIKATEALVTRLKSGDKKEALAAAEAKLEKLKTRLTRLEARPPAKETAEPATKVAVVEQPAIIEKVSAIDWDAEIREAYLRTVSRPPKPEELQRARQYVLESERASVGMRDVVWALLNTKEFIVNH